MRFYDQHSHTTFSPDARMSVEEAVVKLKDSDILVGLAITDHLDLDPPIHPTRFILDVEAQQKEIARVGKELKGFSVKLFRGVEVGLQPHSIEHSIQYLENFSFDVVIASLHFIDMYDPYRGVYFENKEWKNAFSHALETIYQTITEFKDFDIVGHFDYVARYSPYEVKDIFYKDFPEELDAILKYLADNGKALEINTKTYDLHPNGHRQILDKDILRRFKEVGGEYVTLGSDAHSAQRIGHNFVETWDIIKQAGFDRLTYFENRKAHLYNPEIL